MGRSHRNGQNTVKQLPPYASTREEIESAVAKNSIQRGVFILDNLNKLNIDNILSIIDDMSKVYDKEEWREHAINFNIEMGALDILDNVAQPIPYPVYFCSPDILQKYPITTLYYRNIAMVSRKVMRGIGLDTVPYEAGMTLSKAVATKVAQHFNKIVSSLVMMERVTPRRHLEMVYSNIGDSLGGAWRNEIGRLAYVEIITPLALYLHQQGYLQTITFRLKGAMALDEETDDEEDEKDTNKDKVLETPDSLNLAERLRVLEKRRLVYRELRFRNGNKLLLNRQKTLRHSQNTQVKYKVGPDLLSSTHVNDVSWCAELKGGADPAGSDEHWKTATRAFSRIIEACDKTERPQPPLSFIATILVDRVALEVEKWIEEGKLTSVHNLTKIAASSDEQTKFLRTLAEFLGFDETSQGDILSGNVEPTANNRTSGSSVPTEPKDAKQQTFDW